MSDDVRELLGRAAEDAGRPVISTEAVYAKAGRVRWRRRAAVTATAVCAVAAGAFAVPQLTSGPDAPQTSSVASLAQEPGESPRDVRLLKLLPHLTGTVEEVSFADIIKHVSPPPPEPSRTGPIDGQYEIRQDGGVGYLTIDVMDAKTVARKLGGSPQVENLCEPENGEPARTDCVREELSGGRVLTIWSDDMDYGDGGTPQWGPELVARLTLADGSVLGVRDSTGFEADVVQGPMLKTPPLTRAELRELVLRPELLPAK